MYPQKFPETRMRTSSSPLPSHGIPRRSETPHLDSERRLALASGCRTWAYLFRVLGNDKERCKLWTTLDLERLSTPSLPPRASPACVRMISAFLRLNFGLAQQSPKSRRSQTRLQMTQGPGSVPKWQPGVFAYLTFCVSTVVPSQHHGSCDGSFW